MWIFHACVVFLIEFFHGWWSFVLHRHLSHYVSTCEVCGKRKALKLSLYTHILHVHKYFSFSSILNIIDSFQHYLYQYYFQEFQTFLLSKLLRSKDRPFCISSLSKTDPVFLYCVWNVEKYSKLNWLHTLIWVQYHYQGHLNRMFLPLHKNETCERY